MYVFEFLSAKLSIFYDTKYQDSYTPLQLCYRNPIAPAECCANTPLQSAL